MKKLHRNLLKRKKDYTDAWEEDKNIHIIRAIPWLGEMCILTGIILFGRCGVIGIASKVCNYILQGPEQIATELVIGVGLIMFGLMIHIWAELEEVRMEGGNS